MTDKLKDYTKKGLLATKKIYRLVNMPGRKPLAYNAVLVLSIALLAVTTSYAAFHTSNYFSTDSDAMIATQQFSSGLRGHPVTLPGDHSNLLLIPLFYIQGHLPYNYTSFTLVNIGLVLATIGAWAFLLIKLFGRKYEIPILILLSSLVFTSVTFNLNIGYTTIRNIEYPIALWFVFIVNRLLKNLRYSRRQLVFAAIGSILFCLVLAGDSLFNYAILMPLLLVIAWYWVQSREFTLSMAKAVCLTIGVFIGAALVKVLLSASGVVILSSAVLGAHSILPYDYLLPSIGIAIRQLMELQGGFVFGQTVSLHNLAIFINFGVLAVGIIGLILILVKANHSYRDKKELTDNNFILVTMAVSFFMIFFVYIFSGYVVTLSNGQLVSLLATRYISFLPLISLIGFIWLIKNYYREHVALLFIIFTVVLVGIVTSYPNVRSAYKLDTQLAPTPSRTSVNNIISILKRNNVHEVLTDYWYGPPIRFWSRNSISFALQVGCNQPMPFSAREDWFTPQTNIKSALIIDRGGLFFTNWSCSDDQLRQIYGNPSKELEVAGITPGTHVDIWIYNYDVRQHLLPFPTTD
jgi:hypothetical protein